MPKPQPTIRVVTATQAKNNFGAIIKSADTTNEHLIVEKAGVPIVAIIPIAAYDQFVISRWRTPTYSMRVPSELERAEAGRRLKEVMDEIHARVPEVSEEEADRDIARAIREVRAERAKELGLPAPLPYRQVRSRRKKRK